MNPVELHGGALDAMRRLFPDAPQPWVDLSTGINPWPWTARERPGSRRLPTKQYAAVLMKDAFGVPHRVLAAPGSG